MKKIFLPIMCLSMISLCAYAQIEEVNTVKADFWRFLFTPYSFSDNGTNLPHMQTKDNQLDVYTNEFNLSKSINVSDEILYSTRRVDQTEIIDITFDDKFLVRYDEPYIFYNYFRGSTPEEFIDFIKANYGEEKFYTIFMSYSYGGVFPYFIATEYTISDGDTIPLSGYVAESSDYSSSYAIYHCDVDVEPYMLDKYSLLYYLTNIVNMTQQFTNIENLSTEYIADYLTRNAGSPYSYYYIETSNGDQWFAQERDCYLYERYGAKYPLSGYKVINNQLTEAYYQNSYYDYSDQRYHYFSDEGMTLILSDKTTYLRTDTISTFHSLGILYYYDINNGLSDVEAGFVVSQKLFNEDAGYEYITMVPKEFQYETTNKSYYGGEYYFGVGETKQTYTTYLFSGFNIVSENGNVLSTINFPDDFVTVQDYYNTRVIHLGDNYYLLFEGYMNYVYGDYSSGDHAIVIYKLNVSSSGTNVQQVGQPIQVNVTPTVLSKNEEVNVSLSDESRNHEVRVSDLQGRTIERKNIPAGQKNITIPANKMNSGMNIISVLQNQKIIESKKIIVK